MTRVGEELIKAATEALAFARDEADPEEYRVHIPDEINPRLIRSRLNMSQREFADAFAVELRTLQDLGAGTSRPQWCGTHAV